MCYPATTTHKWIWNCTWRAESPSFEAFNFVAFRISQSEVRCNATISRYIRKSIPAKQWVVRQHKPLSYSKTPFTRKRIKNNMDKSVTNDILICTLLDQLVENHPLVCTLVNLPESSCKEQDDLGKSNTVADHNEYAHCNHVCFYCLKTDNNSKYSKKNTKIIS